MKSSLSAEEIKKLGLKSGLEIHQQLEGKKLFCHCPTAIRDDAPTIMVKRFLRASAGESGKVDAAALAEMKKQRHYLYEGYRDTTCLVELDEEPPGPLNREALQAALQVVKVFGMDAVDEVRFMRKTVVDGSNTSGFQRTGLIASHGSLTTNSGLEVGVESLCLEEDACKKVRTEKDATVYNLSRLGIPLLELATAPDMQTPAQIAEVAEYIGMVMRSLPNVKRGLGTIRQDVNISIAAGVRVEIKGAQDLKMIPTLAEYEALRQHNLLSIFAELKKRKAAVKSIEDVSSIFKNTEGKVIKSALQKKGVVLALALQGFGGLTGLEIVPGRRYGSEMSDHAKLMGVKGLFHADELPKYGITKAEKDAVFDLLGLDKKQDNFLLVAEEHELAQRALEAARDYAQTFSLEKEVRNALPDGTTAFLRPMPGAARMYPETDVRPVAIDLAQVKAPKLLAERVKEWQQAYGLAEEVVRRLLRDGVDLEGYLAKYPALKPAFIVDFFYAVPALVKKKEGVDIDPSGYADLLFEKVAAGMVGKDAMPELVAVLAKGGQVDWSKYAPIDEAAVEKIVRAVVKKHKGAPMGALMGLCMQEINGKADGKVVMALLKKVL